MNVASFTILVWLGGVAAGLLGSLTGLGGGVVIVPLLTLVFGADIRYALGASLIWVIATPILRVVFSVVAFALERDILYVAATLIVLGVLLYSLFVGGT